MTTFAAFGGILFGYDTGTIGGIKVMQNWLQTFGKPTGVVTDGVVQYNISTADQSLVVSILSAGTFFGALFGAPMADIVGRKFGVVLSCAVFALGVALQTAGTNWATFIIGRVFAGLGVGLVSVLIPMYQAETAPKWLRGAIMSVYQWAITIGLLLAAIVTNFTQTRQNKSAWRVPIAIQFVWAFILVTGMLILPESPRWLIKRGRDADAAVSLGRLLSLPPSDPMIEHECADIRANLEEEQRHGESSYLDCFKPSHNRILGRTLTGIFIQAMQQLTGINFIFYYGTTFFQASGIQKPFLITVATNVVNVGMTVPGIWGIERFGRRSLLLWGAVGMCICEYLVAIIGVTISIHNIAGQKVLIAFVCIYIACFAATWGPIAWVITGEIFPLNVRAKAMSLSCASNWLWNFGIGYMTPYLVNTGPGNAGLQVKVFFLWGSTCLLCIFFTYFCVPETKGLSLEQIDVMYQNASPRQSYKYRAELLANDPTAFDADGGRIAHHTAEKTVAEEQEEGKV
jgi:sugar porter (SP) family MFS transporter